MFSPLRGARQRPSRRFLSGPRWWRWFLVLAAFGAVHDGLVHWSAPRPLAAAEKSSAEHGDHDDGEHGDGHHGDDHGGGHHDPAGPVLLAIVVIMLAAKLAGDVFDRLSMPAVLGELMVGVLLGNIAFFFGVDTAELAANGPDGIGDQIVAFFEVIKPPENPEEASAYHTGAVLQILASIGVVLLLFEVGLESSVKGMMSVGVSAMLVAILGVVVPIALGYACGWVFLPSPEYSGGLRHAASAFIGATLCATSVGITARVLKDLGRSQQKESQIILGAAVVDDVLGLVVLAIVSGVIAAAGAAALDSPAKGGSESVAAADAEAGDGEAEQAADEEGKGPSLAWDVTKIILLAFGFLAGALLLGAVGFQRALFKYASALRGHGMLVATSLVICFGFSYMANAMGLATIVGAFAAGLILEGAHYKELGERENHHLEEALAPLSGLLVPIFFVDMGLQVDLESFTRPSVWALAGAMTVAAIVGKQVCSLGVREPGLNKLAVGLGMIPRGEVGLIFANEGRKLMFGQHEVIDNSTYAAVIVMVMVTTMVTPPLLKWSMSKDGGAPEEGPTDPPTEPASEH